MSSIVDMLMGQLGGDARKQISGNIGTDENKTQDVMAMALPLLMGALSKNASEGDGASSLSRALDKDHDGSILDNLSGFLGSPESGPGDGILKHVLGERRERVESGLAKSSGLDTAAIGKLLVTLAPVVLGALGKQKRETGMDSNALAGLLSNERAEVERRAPKEMGLLASLIDSDDDGDVDISDIARGAGLLGKLFGKS
jgi:hypothetical protein